MTQEEEREHRHDAALKKGCGAKGCRRCRSMSHKTHTRPFGTDQTHHPHADRRPHTSVYVRPRTKFGVGAQIRLLQSHLLTCYGRPSRQPPRRRHGVSLLSFTLDVATRANAPRAQQRLHARTCKALVAARRQGPAARWNGKAPCAGSSPPGRPGRVNYQRLP